MKKIRPSEQTNREEKDAANDPMGLIGNGLDVQVRNQPFSFGIRAENEMNLKFDIRNYHTGEI